MLGLTEEELNNQDRGGFNTELEPVPGGTYTLTIAQTEQKTSSTGKTMVKLEITVASGEHKGRKMYENHTFTMDDPQKRAMSVKKWTAICIAAGLPGPTNDPGQLVNRTFVGGVSVQPARIGNDGKHYKASNRVDKWQTVAEAQAEFIAKSQGAAPPPQQQDNSGFPGGLGNAGGAQSGGTPDPQATTAPSQEGAAAPQTQQQEAAPVGDMPWD